MIIPVILAGGSGTRLWPLSRALYSKQFLNLTDDQSLLQQSVARARSISKDELIIIGNEEQRFLVAEQLRAMDQAAHIILEPKGRNTAPAIALAALHAQSLSADAKLLVMPADHTIADNQRLAEAIERALPLCDQGRLVTFGIPPDSPHTGYGYIQKGEALLDGYRVAAFVEKPELETAQRYLDSGEYQWNSGMFFMRAADYLEELAKWAPEIDASMRQAYASCAQDLDFLRVDSDAFLASPSDSIDYAILEKTDRAAMVELDTQWSDIGSFTALWQALDKDDNGNALHGDTLCIDSHDNLIHAGNRLVATIGLRNTVVVETKDAVLVADQNQVQNVKQVVQHLKSQNRSEADLHREVHRPWGKYDSIDQSEGYLVKRITVYPHQKLSLQYHHHRAEHWVVVRGTATVHLDGEVLTLAANQSIYIPQTSIHSLENREDTPLEIIEVQTGSILVEEDIVRVEDIYGR